MLLTQRLRDFKRFGRIQTVFFAHFACKFSSEKGRGRIRLYQPSLTVFATAGFYCWLKQQLQSQVKIRDPLVVINRAIIRDHKLCLEQASIRFSAVP